MVSPRRRLVPRSTSFIGNEDGQVRQELKELANSVTAGMSITTNNDKDNRDTTEAIPDFTYGIYISYASSRRMAILNHFACFVA